jgi:hypothetical protein
MKDDEDLMKPEGNEVAPVVPATNTRVRAAQDAARRDTPPPGGKSRISNAPPGGNTPPPPNPNPTATSNATGGNPRFDTASGVIPSPAAAPPAAGPEAWDPLINNDPDIDISEEQALIEELLQGQIGNGNADLRAQFGAGGGGRSGALLAAQEQMRINAARQAAGQILDARNQAEDDWRQNIVAGSQLEQQDRGGDLAQDAAERAAAAEAAAASPNFTDNNSDGKDDYTGYSLEQSQRADQFRTGQTEGIYWNPFVAAGSKDNPFSVARQDAGQLAALGLQKVGTDGFGQVIYYDPQTKSYYAVHN